jgi:hypothetical protein
LPSRLCFLGHILEWRHRLWRYWRLLATGLHSLALARGSDALPPEEVEAAASAASFTRTSSALMRSVQGDAREEPAKSRYNAALVAGTKREDMKRFRLDEYTNPLAHCEVPGSSRNAEETTRQNRSGAQLITNWQLPNALARRREDRVGDGGRHWR